MWGVAACVAFLAACASSGDSAPNALSWFAASDTHLGHDVGPSADNVTTSYTKNVWAITEMNALPGNDTWPAALGGGPVLPPVGVTVSGDLIDAGVAPGSAVNGCNQWANFTALFGLDGTDGLLHYRVYEGRGNHDGPNTTNPLPRDCTTTTAPSVAARNTKRAADPAFAIDAVSSPTGLHYSWTWNITDACRLHFVHLNLYPGHACGSPGNPGREGKAGTGFSCAEGTDGWSWPEDSLGFLQQDLPAHASANGTVVVAIQHYGYDGWSLTWFNADQAAEMFATLARYRTLAVLVGHTHSAGVYAFNGTHQSDDFDAQDSGYIGVVNAPATQKEDGEHAALPSEFMALEASVDDATGKGTLRVAQRVGHGWGKVMGTRAFQCY